MIDKFKKFFAKNAHETVNLSSEEQRRAVLEKEKEQATKDGKAWVAVLDTKVNPENIRNGFFELDWNNEFIEQLLDAGYKGETQEEIVDSWFKTIAQQLLDSEGLDKSRAGGYIDTKDIGEGKTEKS